MSLVNGVEATIRGGLTPIALIAKHTLRHNELNFIAQKPTQEAVSDLRL